MTQQRHQDEVEEGPFQDNLGRWHHPNGAFMTAEHLERLGLENDPSPENFMAPRRPGRPRKEDRHPEGTEDESEENGDSIQEEGEEESLTFDELVEQFHLYHEQQGQIVQAIVREVERMREQISTIAEQLAPRHLPARQAAKVGSGESTRTKGPQGKVRRPDDRRLRQNRGATES